MKKISISLAIITMSIFTIVGFANDSPDGKNKHNLSSQLETNDKEAYELLKKDAIKPAKRFKMPAKCVSTAPEDIETGRILFNNLNNANGQFKQYDTKKLFGNCIACHQIEKGEGYGNIGPNLSNYNETFVKTGARTHEWMYQKISDPRIDHHETVMTVNLTTGLMNEKEICDLVSYIVSDK